MRLGLVWLVAIVGGLSWASFKRGDYLLPAYPGAALFLGCVLDRWRQEASGREKLYRVAVPLLLAILVGGVTMVWIDRVCRTLPREEAYRDYQRFAAVIRKQAPDRKRWGSFVPSGMALAFHVGQPMETVSEWSELDSQAGTGRRPIHRHAAADGDRSPHGKAASGLGGAHKQCGTGRWQPRTPSGAAASAAATSR